jgi:hypothetical protein
MCFASCFSRGDLRLLVKVTYVPDKNAVVWTIKQFNGSREYLMRAHFGLPSVGL